MSYLLILSRKKYNEILTPKPNIKELQSYCVFTLMMVNLIGIDLMFGILNSLIFVVYLCLRQNFELKYVNWA